MKGGTAAVAWGSLAVTSSDRHCEEERRSNLSFNKKSVSSVMRKRFLRVYHFHYSLIIFSSQPPAVPV